MAREFPTNAARGSAHALTGAGSANDVFPFAVPAVAVVQNNTAAAIQVFADMGAGVAATAGDEVVAAGGGRLVTTGFVEFVSIFGAAAAVVNGTATAGIVVYGLSE